MEKIRGRCENRIVRALKQCDDAFGASPFHSSAKGNFDIVEAERLFYGITMSFVVAKKKV